MPSVVTVTREGCHVQIHRDLAEDTAHDLVAVLDRTVEKRAWDDRRNDAVALAIVYTNARPTPRSEGDYVRLSSEFTLVSAKLYSNYGGSVSDQSDYRFVRHGMSERGWMEIGGWYLVGPRRPTSRFATVEIIR